MLNEVTLLRSRNECTTLPWKASMTLLAGMTIR